MATIMHEVTSAAVTQAIHNQLFSLRTNEDTDVSQFVRRILNTLSRKIFLNNGNKHSPNGSFAVEGLEFPGVVIEVSYSQPKKNSYT